MQLNVLYLIFFFQFYQTSSVLVNRPCVEVSLYLPFTLTAGHEPTDFPIPCLLSFGCLSVFGGDIKQGGFVFGVHSEHWSSPGGAYFLIVNKAKKKKARVCSESLVFRVYAVQKNI